MKQTIRLTESELNRIISESVQHILNEEKDEVGGRTHDYTNDLGHKILNNNPFTRNKSKQKRNPIGIGSDSKYYNSVMAKKAADERSFDSKFHDRLRGMVNGFKNGFSQIDNMNRKYQTLQNNYKEMSEYGSEYADSGKRFKGNQASALATLERDLDTTIKNDVKRYNTNKTSVNQALDNVKQKVNGKEPGTTGRNFSAYEKYGLRDELGMTKKQLNQTMNNIRNNNFDGSQFTMPNNNYTQNPNDYKEKPAKTKKQVQSKAQKNVNESIDRALKETLRKYFRQ